MSREIYDLVLQDLSDRKTWEDRQRLWYDMRHNGIRRRTKPFPGAADLHYPLADGQIDKLKPFYFAQIFGSEQIAAFVSKKQQMAEATASAAQWYHYQMLQHTNFFRESLSGIDNMLMAGNALLMFWWDEYEQQLVFDAIDPVFAVLPPGTVEIQKADRFTRILQMTESAYKRREDYDQDDALIKRIKGKEPTGSPSKQEEKYNREGITFGQNDDQIVLHETWEHTKSGWRVHTYSPMSPDTEIKPSYQCTYKMGGKSFLPVVDFPMEVKDKGYYASRGIPERVAAFEAYICRTWNEKADAMTFLNRPLFTHEGSTINLNNVRLIPGQVVGNKLSAVQMPTPPVSFDIEMQSTRQAAEYLVAMPDFGLGGRQAGKKDATATEVNAIGNIMQMSTDLRARIFRQALSNLYRMTWAVLREKKQQDLTYFFADEMQQAPAEALHDEYLIEPDGSPDSWNKPQRMQRAVARFQMFKGSPFVDQGKLTKSVLQEDDPRVARDLYVDPQTTAADQQEDQAMELGILEMGFPARVKPSDDDAIHLDTTMGRVEMMLKTGQEITPVAWQRMNEHMMGHVQQMQTRDPKRAKQYMAKIQRVQQAMAEMFPPAPVTQFPPAQAGGPAAAVAGGVR